MKKHLTSLALLFSLSLTIAQNSQTFNFTGGMQTFTVPACITSITVDVRGAQGANSNDKLLTNAIGGRGGRVVGVLAVTPGQVYNIFVGGVGNISGAGGYNGGGIGGTSSAGSSCFGGPAAGGGGASDIRFGGTALGNRIVVAGGGGGSGRDYCNGWCQPCGCGGSGGSGGLLTGVNGYAANNCGFNYPGTNVNGGFGGSQVAGGNGGPGDGAGFAGTAGVLGTGGNGANGSYDVAGGGGGGGYYGGGGGGGASSGSGVGGGGGGGGSSFIGPLTSAVTSSSIQLGNGVVTISYLSTASVAIVASNTTVCAGTPVTLTANGTLTYTWSTGSNATNIVVTPTTSTTYTLTGSNGTSCTASTTILISITPPPIIPATNPSVCVGSAINLTSSGGSTYSWSGPLGFTSGLQNPTIANATNPMSGAYTVTVTTAAGCSNTAVSNVTVINVPTANLVSNSPVCLGGNLTFTASGGVVNLTGPNGFVSAANNPTITNVNNLANGTYTLLVSAGTCTASTTNAVVINPLPVPIITSNSPVCINKPINFTGNGGVTYAWVGPNGYTSSAQNPIIASASATNAGTYTLTVTNANGCTGFSTTVVTINTLPVIAVTNPSVCLGSSINLSSNGGSTYSWLGPLAFNSALQNPTIVNSTNAMSGGYTVTVTSAAGCTNSAVSNVTVINVPTANLVSNSPVCLGGNLTFTASGGVVNLTGPNGFVSAANNPTITNVNNLANGTYTLLVSAGTCTASTTNAVIINPLPVPIITSNSPVCINKPINFTGNGGVTYAWVGPNGYTSSAQNPIIASASATNAGTYTLTVTNASGCTGFSTTVVTINTLPVIAVTNPSVCLGSAINLSSNGGATYLWSGPLAFNSALQNPTIANSTNAMSGGYTVTVTSAAGCTNSAVSNVTVINVPTANLLNNAPVCVGGNLTFTASGGIINLTGPNGFLSAANNPTITNVSNLANGTYTLLVSAGTCTASTTNAVVINPLPVPIITSNSPVCINNTINFTGSGGITYSWAGPNGFTSSAQNPIIASATATNAGTYTLTVTNASGCTGFSTTAVTISALPVIVPLNNPTVCLNTTINLASNGGSTYSWTGPLGFTSALQNPNIANATLGMSGAYNVIVTSAVGCTNSAIANVTVLPLPVPAITSNTPCVGATLNLSASGGATYAWIGPNGFFSALQNPSIVNVLGLANGTYSLIASVGSCSALITSPVTINALPVVIALNNSPACETKSVQLTAGGGVSYQWTGPSGFTNATQNPTLNGITISNAGVYTVTAIDANNCIASNTTAVITNTNPIVNANGASVCFGSPATLMAGGGTTYAWTGPNGYTSTNANANVPVANVASSGSYTVVVTNSNGCSSTSAVGLATTPIPSPNITGTSRACVNGVITLQGSGGINYSWAGPAGFLSGNQTITLTVTSVNMGGNYTLTANNNGGCLNSTSIPVIVDPLPEATLKSDGKNSCAPFCANFNLQTQSGSSTIVSTLWQIGSESFTNTQFNYCFDTPGSYNVNAIFTDGNGCANTSTYAIIAYGPPSANFETSPYKPIEGEDVVNFTNTSTGPEITTWNWYFTNNSGYTSDQQNTSYLFEKAGEYPVAMIAGNKWGCTDTVVKFVTINEEYALFIPNSFTPNGDGLNDLFLPKGRAVTKYNLVVFDRWGQKLFETKEFEKGWDGKFNGIECKNDTYVWKITTDNDITKRKEYTGHVTISR